MRMDEMLRKNREDKITQMEKDLNEAGQAVQRFSEAWEEFKEAQEKMKCLAEYYGSPEWFQDLEAYEKGELSEDLKCGVLSEDLIYNLLMENDELVKEVQETMQKIAQRNI